MRTFRQTAMRSAERAEIAFATAASPAIGGNRLNPVGPKITEVPVIAVRSAEDHRRWIGVMFVNPVHPTVLHEDTTMVSGDLPSMCRLYLRRHMLGADCPVLCPLGTAGNQSPRHVAKSHTFAEVRESRNTIETVSLSRRNNFHANVCAPVELAPSRQATNGQRRGIVGGAQVLQEDVQRRIPP